MLREIAKVEKGEALMVGIRECQGTEKYRNISSQILTKTLKKEKRTGG